MRLIHTEKLEMKDFQGDVESDSFPTYAILSHRWRDDEIDFQDFESGRRRTSLGYRKVAECCRFAKAREISWIWVDTCCIDKRSSAELSEAINSMFKWYVASVECYVYLDDVSFPGKGCTAFDILKSCAWASRGWTLQELIAPDTVIFLTNRWQILGVKTRALRPPDDLPFTDGRTDYLVPRKDGKRPHDTRGDAFEPAEILEALVRRTRIPVEVLRRKETLSRQSAAAKMSWMSGRSTTRVEDQAYCLLGLFSINMPMLYGEGDKAFGRLQEEILRQSSDESIFAWTRTYRGSDYWRDLQSSLPAMVTFGGQHITTAYRTT